MSDSKYAWRTRCDQYARPTVRHDALPIQISLEREEVGVDMWPHEPYLFQEDFLGSPGAFRQHLWIARSEQKLLLHQQVAQKSDNTSRCKLPEHLPQYDLWLVLDRNLLEHPLLIHHQKAAASEVLVHLFLGSFWDTE